ncbi:uncharacterized protein BT62DRAFT_1081154 [Guyanagaster necrorhizus]|uniref:F-box domain-containing protein n=1 Tax=Guyanagaster necrorhizus TaxID=856835 RepID=A0A9P7VFN2_9AGAR|nr:uncharacterized protein BT62DRAFT_1081154 [Guyanagaster necrorhizus MCA 3950]KAG7440071.1 hypothetical protein BT62DRAFT_1081154 [Guyanagaster necrorhizus MCA 3950]
MQCCGSIGPQSGGCGAQPLNHLHHAGLEIQPLSRCRSDASSLPTTMQDTHYLLEDEASLRRQTYHSVSWPPTTVFDKAIYNSSMSYKIFNHFDEDGPIDVSQDIDFKVARLEAFITTMIGFYSGDLDLTGRRLSRFEFYSSRWSLFLADVEALAPFVLEFERGWTSEGLLEGQGRSYVYYEIQNEEMWENFRERWLVPSSYVYEDVKEWTDSVVRQITDSKGEPKIQKLFLLDLPDELLDLVFQQGGSGVVRLLSRTCRHMRALGAPYTYRFRSIRLCVPSTNEIALILGRSVTEQKKNRLFWCYQQSLDKAHQDIAFLVARPDITKQIEILNIRNSWAGSGRLPTTFDTRYDLSSVLSGLSAAFPHGESITIWSSARTSFEPSSVAEAKILAAVPSFSTLTTCATYGWRYLVSVDLEGWIGLRPGTSSRFALKSPLFTSFPTRSSSNLPCSSASRLHRLAFSAFGYAERAAQASSVTSPSPEPSATYASQLASLLHLRYFGWNLGEPIPPGGPVPEETSAEENADKEDADADNDEAPSDPDEIAAMFAKRCVALEVFMLHDVSLGWDICRTSDGRMRLKKMSDFRCWESIPWNPMST